MAWWGDRLHHRGRKLVGDLLMIHQGVVVIKDFDWLQNSLVAPLKHSVLYFGEPGDEASVSSTVCYFLLVNQGHT